jgi:hypothetical protein
MDKWTNELDRKVSKEEVQMAHNYIKTCSISPAIKEMQIRRTLIFYFTPVRMANIKNTSINKLLARMQGKMNSYKQL